MSDHCRKDCNNSGWFIGKDSLPLEFPRGVWLSPPLWACEHMHRHTCSHVLFEKTFLRNNVPYPFKLGRGAGRKCARCGVHLDPVINIPNLLSGFRVSQRSSSHESWCMGWQSLLDLCWYNMSQVPGNNKDSNFLRGLPARKARNTKTFFTFPPQASSSLLVRRGVWEDCILSD